MIRRRCRHKQSGDRCISSFEKYGLICVCLSTVYRWVKKLGFSCKKRVTQDTFDDIAWDSIEQAMTQVSRPRRVFVSKHMVCAVSASLCTVGKKEITLIVQDAVYLKMLNMCGYARDVILWKCGKHLLKLWMIGCHLYKQAQT
jgi:hypothetical protein